jgi:hypothetical protein
MGNMASINMVVVKFEHCFLEVASTLMDDMCLEEVTRQPDNKKREGKVVPSTAKIVYPRPRLSVLRSLQPWPGQLVSCLYSQSTSPSLKSLGHAATTF